MTTGIRHLAQGLTEPSMVGAVHPDDQHEPAAPHSPLKTAAPEISRLNAASKPTTFTGPGSGSSLSVRFGGGN